MDNDSAISSLWKKISLSTKSTPQTTPKSETNFKSSFIKRSNTNENRTLQSFAKNNIKPLPYGFAEDLVENEYEIEKDIVDLKVVNKLTELYTCGMEYYATVNKPDRVQIYQNKLKQLMIRPNVLAAFDRLNKGQDSQEAEIKMNAYKKQKKLQEFEIKIVQHSPHELEHLNIIKTFEENAVKIKNSIEKNLAKQIESMKIKLEARKRSKFPKNEGNIELNSENNIQSKVEPQQPAQINLEKWGIVNPIQEEEETNDKSNGERRSSNSSYLASSRRRQSITIVLDIPRNFPIKINEGVDNKEQEIDTTKFIDNSNKRPENMIDMTNEIVITEKKNSDGNDLNKKPEPNTESPAQQTIQEDNKKVEQFNTVNNNEDKSNKNMDIISDDLLQKLSEQLGINQIELSALNQTKLYQIYEKINKDKANEEQLIQKKYLHQREELSQRISSKSPLWRKLNEKILREEKDELNKLESKFKEFMLQELRNI